MKRLKLPFPSQLSVVEWTTLLLSLAALLVSLWSVSESRNAMLQSRRAEVRATAIETLDFIRSTYASSSCTLKVIKQNPQAEQFESKFKKSAEKIDDMRASLEAIQTADFDRLQGIESSLDLVRSKFSIMRDATVSFKANLTADELARVGAICGAEG